QQNSQAENQEEIEIQTRNSHTGGGRQLGREERKDQLVAKDQNERDNQSDREPKRCQTLKASEQSFDQIFARRQHDSHGQGGGEDHTNRDVCRHRRAFLQTPNENCPAEQRDRRANQRIDIEQERDS